MSNEEIKEEKAPIQMNTVPEYDPSKQYTWEPDAKFELTGSEFGLWLNTVRGLVSSKESMQLRMAMEANNVIEKIMAHGVSKGVIVESKEEQ